MSEVTGMHNTHSGKPSDALHSSTHQYNTVLLNVTFELHSSTRIWVFCIVETVSEKHEKLLTAFTWGVVRCCLSIVNNKGVQTFLTWLLTCVFANNEISLYRHARLAHIPWLSASSGSHSLASLNSFQKAISKCICHCPGLSDEDGWSHFLFSLSLFYCFSTEAVSTPF